VDQCRGERLSVGSNCLVHKTGRHIPTSRYITPPTVFGLGEGGQPFGVGVKLPLANTTLNIAGLMGVRRTG